MKLYPLKFTPVYSYRIWGGEKLKTELNKNYDQNSIGESWEVSGVPGNETKVSEGPLSGKTLKDLIETYKDELVGQSVYDNFGSTFPLLIKFIDAKSPLSIQVHPNDDLARQRHNSYGKNEMWYVMQAEKKAELIVGFNKRVTQEIYQEHLQNNTLPEILNTEKVKEGSAYYIPAGRVHAIGEGVLIAEIQQTSDITYRIYDYDRIDKTTGKKRDLHTNLALDAIDYNHYASYETGYETCTNKVNKLIFSPYFKTNSLHLKDSFSRDLSSIKSFVIYICVEGETSLQCFNTTYELSKGETILIPATIEHIDFTTKGVKLLEVHIT
ncbi:type I phosphomannose isomerase catalytic subunit [Dokdonia donghaensis]|uniref:Phosphohexomutase n=1 Tax=Dokdonia donghaensis DSW-1 TaxID=1300343 RepID=A0A0A2GRP9_9FLAO|nr:type I phosphomannose isomerase catalytic subunit [Dokdonia donghaensis]ANH60770.1 Putative mannose-6-phosphate isomerase YvyI [Dokdonia donghaensis DSW-1]KGO05964.1 mannose-6-phosphate isomerase [Dokdonia donghaensis DSW-1]